MLQMDDIEPCEKIDDLLDVTIRTAMGYDLYPYVFPVEVPEAAGMWWKAYISVDQVRVSLYQYLRDSQAGRETMEEHYDFLEGNDISCKSTCHQIPSIPSIPSIPLIL